VAEKDVLAENTHSGMVIVRIIRIVGADSTVMERVSCCPTVSKD
jgi:hypothetical protein